MQISPYHFELRVSCSDAVVKYGDLREISQGGPLVGSIVINENVI